MRKPTTGGASRVAWATLISALLAISLTGCPPTGDPPPFNPADGGGDVNPGCEDLDDDGYVTAEGCALPAGDCAPEDGQRNPGAAELCNRVDDDCDRATDEGDPGGGDSCDTGLDGICAAGRTACDQGEVACVQVEDRAVREECNGEDDDCDGTTDEDDPGGGAQCDTGLDGRCGQGTETCMGGGLVCVPDEGAATEQCNGEDDDCDGTTDEDNPGGGSDCNTGLQGECAAGAEVCENADHVCRATFERREAELCDGLDDDCDGSTDEAFADLGQPCTVGEGACAREGVRVCAEDGSGTICGVEAGNEVVEICNGEDDDCDGAIDETFADLGNDCTAGVGACAVEGSVVCAEDGAGTICDGVPNAPGDELCNGIDDDCDGETDNGFALGEACAGDDQCQSPGLTVCTEDGAGTTCAVEVVVEPVDEACNGNDDDCDGSVDEAFPTLGDACTNGLGICEAAGAIVCAADGAGVECDAVPGDPLDSELCNGADDDCDGRVDDRAPCPGAPGAAVTTLRIAEFDADDCGRDFDGDGTIDNGLGAVAGLFNPILGQAFDVDGRRAIVLRFPGLGADGPIALEMLEARRSPEGPQPTNRVVDATGAALEQLDGLAAADGVLTNAAPGSLTIPSPLFSSPGVARRLRTASFLSLEQVVFAGDLQGEQVPTARLSGVFPRQAILDAYAAAAAACAEQAEPAPGCEIFDTVAPAALEANLAADLDVDGVPSVSACLILGAEPTDTLPVGGQPCATDDACFVGLACKATPIIDDPALGAALKRRCGPPGALDDGALCTGDAECMHGLCAAAVAGGKRCVSLCDGDDECAAGVCRGVAVDVSEALTHGGMVAGVCLALDGSGAVCEHACDGGELCAPWFEGGLAQPGVEVVMGGRCQAPDPLGAALGETCDDAFDCAHGNGCVPDLEGTLRCAAPCATADACGPGAVCVPITRLPAIGDAGPVGHGACLPVPPAVGSGAPCTADRACPGAETCVAVALPSGDVTRYCARGPGFFAVGQPCGGDDDCASGQCVGGVCGGLCADDADCGSRLYCVPDGALDANGVVVGGACGLPDADCLRDVDCNDAAGCPAGGCVCEARQCRLGCRFPGACPAGLHCRPDNACAPYCRDDAAEPNDDNNQATPLPLGRQSARIEQIAQLCDGSAVDWYRVSPAGLPFRFSVESLTPGVVLDVALLDAFGAPLAEAEQIDDLLEIAVRDPAEAAALAGQLVYLVVRGSGVDGSAEYTLIGEIDAPECPDPAVEPRDASWEFQEVLFDPEGAQEQVDGWICPQDVDWYAVSLGGGDRLTLDVEVFGNDVELPDGVSVRLYGPDPPELGTGVIEASLPDGAGQIVFEVPPIVCVESRCQVGEIRTEAPCGGPAECASLPWFIAVEGAEPLAQSRYTIDAQIERAVADRRCLPDVFESDLFLIEPERRQSALGPQSVAPVPNLPQITTFPYFDWQTIDARLCGGDGGLGTFHDVDRLLMILQAGDRIELELMQDGAQRIQVEWYTIEADNSVDVPRVDVSVQPFLAVEFDPEFAGGPPFDNGKFYGFGLARQGAENPAYDYDLDYTVRFRRLPGDFTPDRGCAEPERLVFFGRQVSAQGNTGGADDDHRPGVCRGGTGGDRVYAVNTPAGGPGTLIATVEALDEVMDPAVSIRTGCDAVNSELACNEDDLTAGDPQRRARTEAQLDGGREVFVIVDSFSPDDEGRYRVNLEWIPD